MLHRPKHACVTRNLEGTEAQVMLCSCRPENMQSKNVQAVKSLEMSTCFTCFVVAVGLVGI